MDLSKGEQQHPVVMEQEKQRENKQQGRVSSLKHSRQPGRHVESRDFAPSHFWPSHIWCLIQADPAAFLSISPQVFLLRLCPAGEGGGICALN